MVLRRVLAALSAMVLSVAVCGIVTAGPAVADTVTTFHPGSALNDDNGDALQAHGSDIVKFGGTYYWYGSAPRDTDNSLPFAAFGGINVYSSTDLSNWHYDGMAVTPTSSGTLSNNLVAYNPRVLYNSSTGEYVMVLSECCGNGTNGQLETGHLVFMTSATPAGPFTFVQDEWPADISVYDMGSFQDDDGTAYVVYSDGNQGISIDELSSDYLSVDHRVAHFSSGQCEEAPAIAKHDGRYFLTDSYCSGWAPNQGHYRSATSMAGPWDSQPDGTIGDSATYNTQAFDILPVTGSAGTSYVWIGDRWDCPQSKCDLSTSTYAWLPLSISGSAMTLNWHNSWNLDLTTGTWTADPALNMLGSQVPSARDLTDGITYELGTKFESSSGGQVSAIRYLRAPDETGSHTGHLWSSTGTLLATVSFSDESSAGWQVATLSSPVTIQPDTVYVVSVGINSHYVTTNHGFDDQVGSDALHSVADDHNGVYGTIGSFPTNSYENSNYFVDVSLEPSDYTVLGNESPALTDITEGHSLELGMKFESSTAGQVTAVRYYRAANETGSHTGRIWSSSGTLLASVTFSGETSSGWQTAALSSPLTVQADTEYVVSVGVNSYYVATNHDFDNPVVNGPLSAVADGANGVYGAIGSFPTNSYENSNYFTDISFTPST